MVKVLLLGGHGKVALYITKHLVANSHNVVSIIRNPAHSQEILDFVGKGPGSVTPIVQSLEEITNSELSELVKGIDWVIWSAGKLPYDWSWIVVNVDCRRRWQGRPRTYKSSRPPRRQQVFPWSSFLPLCH